MPSGPIQTPVPPPHPLHGDSLRVPPYTSYGTLTVRAGLAHTVHRSQSVSECVEHRFMIFIFPFKSVI